jgi:hypothetical protein
MATTISDYDEEEDYSLSDEFHSVFTVQLGELIHDGLIDFTDGTWNALPDGTAIDWYSDEQRDRLFAKIKNHYFYNEIGELPYSRWKNHLLIKLSEIMPKYKFIYAVLDDGVDIMQLEDDYGKRRNIYSDFPQTRLSDNEDYASSGNDNEYENIKHGNFVELVNKMRNEYSDPDLLIINELDVCFYYVLTSNINGY